MSSTPVHLNGRSIRAVILDFGEVLSYPPPPATTTAMAELLHLTREDFRRFYYAERHHYDRGELTAEQYWQAVARDAGVQLAPEQIEWLRRNDVEMWSNINPAMLDWAENLRSRGIQTAVLSNMHADMAKAVRAEFAWIHNFDCFVLSAELGYAKPEPEIFQHCLDCLKVPASDALFIDDKPRNAQAAGQLGMVSICADTPAVICQRLLQVGWDGPLPG